VQASREINDALQGTRELIANVQNLSALGVLALVVIFGILYVVLVQRKKTDNNDIVNKLIEQMQADRKDRQELQNRLFQRDEQREARMIESVSAMSAVIESLRVVMAEVKSIALTFNSRDIQSSAAIDKMLTEGSAPVKDIRTIADKLLEKAVKADDDTIELKNILTDLKIAVAQITDRLNTIMEERKRKTDSQPIPAIPATVPTQAVQL
jgi:hypothetical protein